MPDAEYLLEIYQECSLSMPVQVCRHLVLPKQRFQDREGHRQGQVDRTVSVSGQQTQQKTPQVLPPALEREVFSHRLGI